MITGVTPQARLNLLLVTVQTVTIYPPLRFGLKVSGGGLKKAILSLL
jgi:hypothetical protein